MMATEENLRAALMKFYSITGYRQTAHDKDQEIAFSEPFVRYLSNNKQMDTLKKHMTAEFLKMNFMKDTINVRVTPDVRVVPGASILLLDRNGDHIVAFCSGVDYAWTTEGSCETILSIVYPRRYNFDTSTLTEYCNMLEKDSTEIKRFERMVGSTFIDNITTTAEDLLKQWCTKYDCSSRRFFKDNSDYLRTICTMTQYMQFFGVEDFEIENVDMLDVNNDMFTKMPQKIVDQFDTDDEAADFSMLKYKFYDVITKELKSSDAIKPDYDSIGEFGEIVPSTYASGIVDCYLKYLLRIGNFINM
jgi:hypothetical protein